MGDEHIRIPEPEDRRQVRDIPIFRRRGRPAVGILETGIARILAGAHENARELSLEMQPQGREERCHDYDCCQSSR